MKTALRLPVAAFLLAALTCVLVETSRAFAAPLPVRAFGFGTLGDLAISPNGKEFVTCGNRGLMFWDLQTGAFLRAVPEVPLGYERVIYSADGSRLLSGAHGTATLWDVATLRVLGKWTLEGGDHEYGLSPDGCLVLIGRRDIAIVWDTETGEQVYTIPWSGYANACFTKDSQHLLICHQEAVENRNARTGELIWSITVHGAKTIAVAPDGQTFATMEWHGEAETICLWSVRDGSALKAFPSPGAGSSWTDRMTFSADGSRILTTTGTIWDVQTGTLLVEFEVDRSGNWVRGGLAPDGSKIIVAGYGAGPRVTVWNATSLAAEGEFPCHGSGGRSSIGSDGLMALIGGQLWDIRTGELLHVFDGRGKTAISTDGTMGVTETKTNGVALWDLATKELIRTFDAPVGGVSDLALSSDQKHLAVAVYGPDPPWEAATRLYALGNGSLLRIFDTPNVQSIAFSPDGTRLATYGTLAQQSGPFGVILWQVDTGQSNAVFQPNGDDIGDVAFSPDGSRLAAVSGTFVSCHVWDLATGHQLFEWPGMGASVAFSPDGRFVVVGGLYGPDVGERSIIYSLQTGQEVCSFPPAGSVMWTPDGKHVLLDDPFSGTRPSGLTTLWDVRSILGDLRIVNSQGGLEARWDTGTLQYAPNADGPWIDLPVRSPMPLSAVGGRGFFRVKLEQ